MMRHTAAALVLLASPAFAQTAPPQEGPITCASPVAPDDTERSLKQRFGKDAVVQDLPGAEGEKYKGLAVSEGEGPPHRGRLPPTTRPCAPPV